jgi:hypothetical protein
LRAVVVCVIFTFYDPLYSSLLYNYDIQLLAFLTPWIIIQLNLLVGVPVFFIQYILGTKFG